MALLSNMLSVAGPLPHLIDGGHHAVDLLGGFFFVGFDVPGRVGADEDVVHLNLSTPAHTFWR